MGQLTASASLIEQTAGSIPDFPLDVDEGFIWDEEEEEETAATNHTNATTEQ